MDFLYHKIFLGMVGFLIEWVPWWAWVILAALALALGWRFAVAFWKLFGWQGVLAVTVAILTLGAYRQGWLDHKTAVLTGIPKDDPLFDLSPKKAKKLAKKSKSRPTIFDREAIPDFLDRLRGKR